ncbi:MAG: hypothetical protein AB1792_01760 [Candidatus Zixiibacteriota bacterium]
MTMRRGSLALAAVALALIAGCSGSNPTKPHNQYTPLAGGGRQSGDDPFRGGPGESGPENPIFDSLVGFVPIFYSDIDCANQPAQRVIDNETDWKVWWEATNSCLWRGPMGPDDSHPQGPRGPMGQDSSGTRVPARPGVRFDSLPIDYRFADPIIVDTNTVDTTIIDTLPCDRCIPEAPEVDFSRNVVIVIALAPDSGAGCARYISVTGVESSGGGTVVSYDVLTLSEECCALMERPQMMTPGSPTIAVLVPRPVTEPVTWDRHDLERNCSWGPDLNEPQTIYYTDAACDLGPDEVVITDSLQFAEWINTAVACDSVRWYDHWVNRPDSMEWQGDSVVMPHDPMPGDSMVGGQPVPMPPWWGGVAVDFSTHAVIILRAGETSRWGGGVWLDDIRSGSTGTVIDYSVMIPGDDCPTVDDELSAVNPTVAIRVPLPVTSPVTWNRRTETIECNWMIDSSGMGLELLRPR